MNFGGKCEIKISSQFPLIIDRLVKKSVNENVCVVLKTINILHRMQFKTTLN